MKRSEINRALREMEQMAERCRFPLPDFCAFTPDDWQSKGHEYDEVRDNQLGWDITDYGLGRFDEVGFSLITLRNGNRRLPEHYPKPYAEKLLYLKEGQVAPMHFHWYKMEDIINRGGGAVLIRVYNSLPDEEIDRETPVAVHCDGRSASRPGRASPSTRDCTTTSPWKQAEGRYCWERSASAMTMSMTTALTRRSAAFPPLRRMSRLTACSATNTRP